MELDLDVYDALLVAGHVSRVAEFYFLLVTMFDGGEEVLDAAHVMAGTRVD